MPRGHPELDGGVLQLVNLTKAVAGYIDRGSIAAGQKNGRKRACTANPAPLIKRVRPYKPCGPCRHPLSLKGLCLLDPRLIDSAQAELAAQQAAPTPETAPSSSLRKHGWDIVLLESSDHEFENPKSLNTRTRGQSRALTEPL